MRLQLILCISIAALIMFGLPAEKAISQDADVPPVRKPTFKPMTHAEYKAAYPEVEGLDCGMTTYFDTFINVYGVTVAAMPNTPVPDVIHAAKVYAQIMDSDEDFVPDDLAVYAYHFADPGGSKLIMLVDTKDLDNEWNRYRPCRGQWTEQALRPDHSGVGHSRDGEGDTAVEELFHFYTQSLQAVYPEDFGEPRIRGGQGEQWSSKISDAMDKARGFGRDVTTVPCGDDEDCDGGRKWVYPEGAWYTYSAVSCGWGCMLDEYTWHVWASWIGYVEALDRGRGVPAEEGTPGGGCARLYNEWRPCGKEDLAAMDTAAYDLFNNQGYNLPETIPYGDYGGNDVEYHGYEVEVRGDDGAETFFINRGEHPAYTFKRGNTYYFDQSLESNAGHSLRFLTAADAAEYDQGVETRGSAGSRGAYTKITVGAGAPDELYYACTNHPGAAGDAVIAVVD